MRRSRANRRDKNESEIVQALRAAGATVQFLDKPLDLLVGFRGKNYLLEVKTDGGVLTGDQADFFATWNGHAKVIRSAEQALREIGASQ